jgi:predicted pyridoxine 5'-phosphate oxidase superfamily flavin-nucleotide-binding protein
MQLPGSKGEHQLQEELGTTRKARAFYNQQMLDYLKPFMREFISSQQMVFIATSDSKGECDCSFRSGLPGFVHVLDDKTLAYPEYRGNGVLASLGNIRENPNIGMIFIDFFENTIGLHVNGKAEVVKNEKLLQKDNLTKGIIRDIQDTGGRKPEYWVMVQIDEAYIHCSKHIPLLKNMDKEIHWGTDQKKYKGGNFFKT